MIWFGILVVKMIEIALITPPVGLNVYVLRGQLPQVPTADISRGTLSFLWVQFANVALILLFPAAGCRERAEAVVGGNHDYGAVGKTALATSHDSTTSVTDLRYTAWYHGIAKERMSNAFCPNLRLISGTFMWPPPSAISR